VNRQVNSAEANSEVPSLPDSVKKIRLLAFDFDGVFTDNAVYVCEDGTETVRCFRGDGIGLRKLEEHGIEAIIISTETNPVVSARSRKLGIRCVQGCEDKVLTLEGICKERGIMFEEVAFVGNDVNDLACLRRVGLPIVVNDAHPDLIPFAKYRTRLAGGHGAVREICDLVERVLSSEEARP
jgi:3-deoxy-D-manno-octulosonate 8-phosphate phosphatase (KDO 8-P phosphatase)